MTLSPELREKGRRAFEAARAAGAIDPFGKAIAAIAADSPDASSAAAPDGR